MIGDLRPSLEADAKKYGVATTRTAYPDGVAGARMVLQEMGRRIREGMIAPSMRAFAEMVVRNWARVPAKEQISDRRAAQIFLDYVREHVRYRYDPDGTEMVMAAPVTLCIPGAPMCIPVGDCLPERALVILKYNGATVLSRVDALRSGDEIWGLNDWSRVQAVVPKGKMLVDVAKLSNMGELQLTVNHFVYRRDGTRARFLEIVEGDELLQPQDDPRHKLPVESSWLLNETSQQRSSNPVRVEQIVRGLSWQFCWDIQTEDHYVYLPEHDVTVSNCDDLVVALGSLMGSYGMQVRIMKQSFGDSNVEHVLVVFKDGESGWLPADPSAPGKEVGWRASATKEVIVNPADPASLNLEGQPEAIFVGVGSIPAWARIGRIGAIITTPGDVLEFRNMWNAYVSGIYQAMLACSGAWSTAAAGSNTPTSSSPINTAQFAVPPDATTLKLWASSMAQDAATLESQWNYYQGIVTTSVGAAQFMSIAPDVLQFFQATVLHAGQYYVPEIQKNCPGMALPSPPTFDVQAQVIGQLEGLQLVARGALGFLGIGTSGALEFYQQLGQKGVQVVDATTKNLPWILGAGIVLGAAVVAVEMAPLIPVRRAAKEARKLMRRRRR